MGDLGQVRLAEQGQLQRAVADRRLYLRGAQRGDPVQASGADVLAQQRGAAPVPGTAPSGPAVRRAPYLADGAAVVFPAS
jgi:hypothetical protein